jgi:predicted permease
MRPENWIYTVPLRLRSLFRRERADRELEDELQDHVEQRAKEFSARGLTPQEARRAAVLEMGGMERRKEECRETRRVNLVQDMLQDLRYAVRMLRKSPAFTVVAVLTIALGIGATTAIFSVVDATLLHPLPYPQPEQLVRIQDDLPGVGVRDVGVSVPEWHDLERSGIFQYVSPMGFGSVNLTGSTQPTRARFSAVPPNYFALLGVKPQLGRAFNPDDKTLGFNLEVMISDGLWKRAFASDPHILDRNLRLDNDMYRVVGVMPPGFRNPGRAAEERDVEVWAAAGFAGDPAPPPLRNLRWLQVAMARLKPGITLEQAQSRVDALVAALQKQFPTDYPAQNAWAVRLIPLKETLVGNVRASLMFLLGAVALVLLIGCVNVANLLLARASARGREMALRQALGAARRRLVRQMLTESFLLSLLGGIAGLAILFCAKGFLLRLVPQSLPRLDDISINWAVLLFAVSASVAAGAIFGLAPALHAGRVDITHSLKLEGRGSTSSGEQARTRRALVVTEFALSLVLMIAAGLLLRSFWGLLNVRLGFNPKNVMAVHLWLPIPNDPKTDIYGTPAREAPFVREVMRRGSALPGVQEIALSNMAAVPLGHSRNDINPFPVIFEGREVDRSQAPVGYASTVTPSYFHLVGMTLLRGREFGELDTDTTPLVAVVNEAFARTYFPNADPLGKRLKVPNGDSTSFTPLTIIGVVADAKTESLDAAILPQMILSLYQRRAKDLAIFVKGARLDAAAIPVEVREQVQAIDPELPVFGGEKLEDALADSLSQRRFAMEMVALFAVTALLLAGLGIYGVISYLVSERTHEIGIRLALGAQRGSILGMVLGQGLRLAIVGAGIGLVCAMVVSRLMAGMLYGVNPSDPLTFGAVAMLLIGVAVLACYIPARRAIGVDPLVALRHE